MTRRFTARKFRPEDMEFVINNIRSADKLELEDASGIPYEQQLKAIENSGDEIWTCTIDGEIVSIFGVYSMSTLTGFGIPWMISTTLIEKYWLTFLRHCRQTFELLIKNFSKLINFVDDRNDLAKMWLKWLGFALLDPEPYGIKGLPYRKFTMEVKNV